MSTAKQPVKKELLPFQAQNVSGNQQGVPLTYFAGTRLIAIKWITPAFGKVTHTVPGAGKKG